MAKIRFERHYRQKDGKAQLYANVTRQGRRLRYPTPVRVNPDEWDQKQQDFTRPKLPNRQERRSALMKIKHAIEDYLLKVDMGELNFGSEELRKYVDEATGIVKRVDRLDELIGQYYGKVIDNRITENGIRISEATKKKFRYLLQRVSEYQDERNRIVFIQNIDTDFFEDFKTWATERYSPNTIRDKYLKPLKEVLNYAEKKGYKIKPDFREWKMRYQKPNHSILYKSEVQKILNLDLSGDPNLEAYQIDMLFGIFTGARPSDFTEFTKDDVTVSPTGEPAIVFYTRKTHDKILIPIPEQLQKILERRSYVLPKTNKNVVARYFKTIGQLAGLDRNEQLGRTRAGRFIVTKGKLYQFIDGKTPKRTFVNGHYYGYLGEKWDPWRIADFTGNHYNVIKDHYIERLSELEVRSAKYDL